MAATIGNSGTPSPPSCENWGRFADGGGYNGRIMTRSVALVLALLPAALWAAEPPVEPLPVAPRPLEDLKFPPGTVVVVRDSREGLGKIDAVVLSPDEYRKLVEAGEQLNKLKSPSKPQPPSVCRVSGKIEHRGSQDVVMVRAKFEFVSPAGRTVYFLGFRKAAAVGATLDGKGLPAIEDAAEGFRVAVDSAGSHAVTLDLEVPLQTRSAKAGERGFALNLPGSPITVIDQFDLPTGVDVVRLRPLVPIAPLTGPAPARTLAAKDLQKPVGDWPAVALGAIEGVELFWDNPTLQKPAEPLITADGEIRVQLGETTMQTTASLLLRSLRGRQVEWKLQTPAGADVTLPGNPAESAVRLMPNNDRTLWTIRAAGNGVEAIEVEVQQRQARQSGKPAAVGPFNLASAFRQQGTVRIMAPNNLRPRVTRPRGDLGQRELPPDPVPAESKAEFVQAMYSYGQVSANSPGSPLMYLDTEAIRGELRTQVTHTLTLTDSGWRITTEIKATPIRREIDFIEVELPAVLQPTIEVGPHELVEKIDRVDPASNRWQIRLAHPRRVETTVRLDAVYPRGEPTDGRDVSNLALPRVRGSVDGDGRVVVNVPEGFDLSGTVREWDRDRVNESGKPMDPQPGKLPSLALITTGSPAVVEMTWAPQGAAVPVKSTTDVTIEDHQIVTRQRLTLPASTATRRITLRAVGPVPSHVRAIEGSAIVNHGVDEWLLTIPPNPDRESVVVLALMQALAESRPLMPGRLDIGLLWPATLGPMEGRVRVWVRTTTGLRPLPAGGPWEELPAETSAEHDSLPALELFAGAQAPLTLELAEAVGLAPAGVIAERVLIQAIAGDAGQQRYRARFLLRSVAAPSVDVELPTAVAALANLEVTLGGKRLDQVAVVDPAGTPVAAAAGRIIRVPLPPRGPATELAVSYILGDTRAAVNRWRLSLTPPRLRGPVFVGPVRWQIMLPEDDFVLPADERTLLEQRWGLRRFLPAPIPARSGRELEEWFRGSSDGIDDQAMTDPSVVARQGSLQPIGLIPIPRMLLYLICSLAVLAMGGALAIIRHRRWLFWLVLMLLLICISAGALLWPQATMVALAGTPPGLFVLALSLAVMSWQARRYRRRVVFLPSFTRTKPPSTMSRPASSQRRRQPSTVDVPPVT
jgi:hypothetical protein